MVSRGAFADMEVRSLILVYVDVHSTACSAFESVAPHQIPPPRRITQDEGPSSMIPMAMNNSHPHQPLMAPGAPFAQPQTQSKPGSSASFASLSGGGGVYVGQGASGNASNPHGRKKARLV